VIGTYDGTTIKQWVDGTLGTTRTITATTTANGGEVRIARRWDGEANDARQFFTGDIAVAKIYDGVLTDEEIVAAYETTSATYPNYTLTPAANNVNEGSSLTFTVGGNRITNGTYYWTIDSNRVDFATASGSFSINNNTGTFSVTPTADSTTEGEQTFDVEVRSGAVDGPVLVSSGNIIINDTSLDPTYSLAPGGANNINEGSGLQFNVGGTDVPAGTYYWTIETGAGDFATTDGTVSVSAGTGSSLGSFTVTPSADATTEGIEAFTVALRSVSITGDILASSGADINDTSLDPEPVTALVSAWNTVDGWLLPGVAGNPDLTPVVAGWTVTGPLDFTATVVGVPFSNGSNWVIPVDASLAGFTPSNQGNYTFTPPA
jgi:hypothetical protein